MKEKSKHDELMAETPDAQPASPALDGETDPNELIARRAYELYEERGCADGDDLNDWFRAEAEVQARLGESEQGRVAGDQKRQPVTASGTSASR